ncbi:transcriptional regulator NanR [Microbaculum marinum]
MTKRAPSRRLKLADQVQEQLLALIRSGEFAPGDPLPSERELMQAFGVGRPAVREGMQALQGMGLLEIRHGGRARVAEPSIGRMVDQMGETMRHLLTHSPASMEHLKEARATFEMEMARNAARKRSDSDLARLVRVVEIQEEARTDAQRFLEFDGQFHREVAAISGNPIFAALSDAIFGWLAHFHIDLVRVPGREQLTLDEHRQIIAAIEARDAEQAARAMLDHLNRANGLYHRSHSADRGALEAGT